MAARTYAQPLARACVATDVVVFTITGGTLQVLLVERSEPPFEGSPALPGGFLWEGETSREAAKRILAAKAGVRDAFIEQLYTFDALGRDPRGHVISIVYYALVPEDRLEIREGEDLETPSLVPVEAVPPLAFDHDQIVAYACERLRSKVTYTTAIASLLPPVFTFTQLQSAYETVLDRPLEKRNFRKKYLSLDLIEALEERLEGTRYRPPQLYRFRSDAPAELPSPFL
ncbi:MAG TPA: NUDIX domain-containing protein [Pseudoflavonifractor sp.]|nr:NUDIX domain-containing protein [Pseudoflavonifractor sp.]